MSRPIASSTTPAFAGSGVRGFDRDAIELEARRLQAIAVADAFRAGGRRFANLPFVADLRLRLARGRLLRRTIRELQQLDDASLADIGLTRGEIRARAVAACAQQAATPARSGFFARLADGIAEARRIARTRRELAAFDERLLRDIGIDRAGAFAERVEQEPVLAQRPIATEPAVQSRFVVGGAAASAEAANDRQPAERAKPAAA